MLQFGLWLGVLERRYQRNEAVLVGLRLSSNAFQKMVGEVSVAEIVGFPSWTVGRSRRHNELPVPAAVEAFMQLAGEAAIKHHGNRSCIDDPEELGGNSLDWETGRGGRSEFFHLTLAGLRERQQHLVSARSDRVAGEVDEDALVCSHLDGEPVKGALHDLLGGLIIQDELGALAIQLAAVVVGQGLPHLGRIVDGVVEVPQVGVGIDPDKETVDSWLA
ncbi:MAG: hypothetical protein R2754_05245 [Microthrixaceae bacterium]